MKQSQLFTKTRKEAPSDEVSRNAQLLIQGGFIHKEMAGAYSLLPLGLRVMNKIEQIIREEMNAIGGQEVEMTTLQEKSLWEKAGKWDDEKVDVWFKTRLKGGSDLGLAFSHEEVIAVMLKNHVNSYRDLPIFIYQFQTKFRNELRAKSGIMRGREFLMKDMYSFNRDEAGLMDFYEKAKQAYITVFNRVGLGHILYITEADGSVFGPRSDEFQIVSEAGEDTIYVDESKKLAVNKEVYNDETIEKLGLEKTNLVEKKAIEAGNIFPIGDRVSKLMDFYYTDKSGVSRPIIMGSYGIGLGRLMGTVVETLADEKGIVWPKSIAPFTVHLISINAEEEAAMLYDELESRGIEVLFDDRDVSAGEKFSDADLIGLPYRVVVSPKTLANNTVEFKERSSDEVEMISRDALYNRVV